MEENNIMYELLEKIRSMADKKKLQEKINNHEPVFGVFYNPKKDKLTILPIHTAGYVLCAFLFSSEEEAQKAIKIIEGNKNLLEELFSFPKKEQKEKNNQINEEEIERVVRWLSQKGYQIILMNGD